MNSIHKVERKDGGNKEEPNAIIIRTSGSERSQRHHDPAIKKEMMKVTEAEEVLVFNEMSRQKQCPRLIGIFEGGRIEEFRKMHWITSKEVVEPKYMEDIAKAFARLHSLKVPLSKSRWEPFWKKAYEGYKNNPFTAWAKELAKENGHDFSPCLSFKHHEDVLWLDKIREKYLNARSKTAFILGDTHYMNLVINEEPNPGELNVYLLDYELCSYGPRGLDLGAHFFNKELGSVIERNFTDVYSMHTEEERRKFLKYYQDELKRLGVKDFDDQGLDSIDNLLFESYVGALLYYLFFNYIAINLSNAEAARMHQNFGLFPITFCKIYLKCKKLLIEKYPFLDPEVIMK